MKGFAKKVITIVLAGSLSAGLLTGCGSDRIDGTKTVATVDGAEIPLGVLSLTARMTQAYYTYLYSMFGSSISWSGMDEESGQTNGESLRDSILENVEKQYVLKAKAGDYGITLSDEDQEKIRTAAADFIADNTEEAIEALGVNEDIVAEYLELQTYQTRIEDPVKAEADTTVDEDEAQQASFTYLSIEKDEEPEETADEAEEAAAETEEAAEAVTAEAGEAAGETEEAAEAVTAEAEEAEAQTEEAAQAATAEAEEAEPQTEEAVEAATAEAGEATAETEEAAEAVTAEAEEAATEAGEEEGPSYTAAEKAQMVLDIMKADPEGDWTDALAEVDDSLHTRSDSFTYKDTEDEHLQNTFDEEVITVLRELAEGEVYDGIIETDSTYYLVRLDTINDEEATQEKIEDVQEELKDEYYEEKTSSWVEEAQIKVNKKVLNTLEISDYHTFTTTQGEEEEAETDEEEPAAETETELTSEADASGEAVTEAEEEAVTEAGAESVTEAAAETVTAAE